MRVRRESDPLIALFLYVAFVGLWLLFVVLWVVLVMRGLVK